jgi:4-amino-4-deoxy-L-arabinose transferase-like glycosyltransferase
MPIRERIVLLLFTLFNIIANGFLPFYSDETYYWMWSKKLALSYFDHPPMVAYLIKATTLFGDSVMEVRLGAPLMMAGSAWLLYQLARKIFDEKTAIYTFYIFLTAIIVQGGATIISPDTPLIFFWSLTLYVAYLYIDSGQRRYAIMTGIFAGALLMSKYTGVLLLVSLTLYILLYRRSLLKSGYLYLAVILCFAVFGPVIYWNYLHDFLSFKFQLGHGIAQEKVFHPEYFFKFVGEQLVLFHPFYLLPLLYFMAKDRDILSAKKMYLVIPFLFPLGFFIYFSASKEANAQWAAPAYLSASILLVYYLAKKNAVKLIIAAGILTALLVLMTKTPLGDVIPAVKNFKARAVKIDQFDKEIKALDLDIDSYDYILIDDYHGTEVAYYFQKYDNVLVVTPERFSNFNIWRHEDLNISMEPPPTSLPKLGKCLYAGISDLHIYQLNQLFGEGKILLREKKKIGRREISFYLVEYRN